MNLKRSSRAEVDTAAEDPSLLWPGMPKRGFTDKFALPKVDPAFLRSFGELSFDKFAPNAKRYRRFSQFVAWFDDERELTLKLLPHRPFIQSAKYNSLSGGILREFEPLDSGCDVTPYIQQLFDVLKINRSRRYHLDIHQYRVLGEPGAEGHPVPEGAHRDGMECVAILVLQRQGITEDSAEFSLIDPDTKKPFFSTVVDSGEGILLNDEKMLHDAKSVVASGDEPGYRDYLVVNINRWEHARYGREHERRAMGADIAQVDDFWSHHEREKLIREMNRLFHRAQRQIAKKDPSADETVTKIEARLNHQNRSKNLRFDGVTFTSDEFDALKRAARAIAEHHKNPVPIPGIFNGIETEDWARYTDVETPPDDLLSVLRYNGIDSRAAILGVQEYGPRASLILTTDPHQCALAASIVEAPFSNVRAALDEMGIRIKSVHPIAAGFRTAVNADMITCG